MKCLFLEAGIHSVAITHFIGLGVALLAFGFEDILWTKLFPIIYLVHIICFIVLAYNSDIIFVSIGVMVVYGISTITELVFGILTVVAYKEKLQAMDDLAALVLSWTESSELQLLSLDDQVMLANQVSLDENWSANLMYFSIGAGVCWLVYKIFAFCTLFTYHDFNTSGGTSAGLNKHTSASTSERGTFGAGIDEPEGLPRDASEVEVAASLQRA